MCPPAVMAALTIASTAASLYGQQQAANAQEKANDAAYKNAVTANNQKNAQISQRQIQERDAATGKIMQNNIEATRAKATAKVSASGAGVGGVSINSLMDDLSSSQGRYNASVGENLRAGYAGADWERVNSYNSMASSINSLKAPAMPNYLGAALQIGTAVDTYNTKSGGSLY